MYRSFNMGIGLIVACRAADADRVMAMLDDQGERPRVIGELIAGDRSDTATCVRRRALAVAPCAVSRRT